MMFGVVRFNNSVFLKSSKLLQFLLFVFLMLFKIDYINVLQLHIILVALYSSYYEDALINSHYNC